MDRQNRLAQADFARVHGQQEYEGLVDEMANIRLAKVHEYGPDLQLIDNWPEASLMAFANIGRKWRRLRNLMFTIPFLKKRTLEAGEAFSLRENLLDMANYCLYAVQMLDKLLLGHASLEARGPKLEFLEEVAPFDFDLEEEQPPPNPFRIEQVAIATRDPGRLKAALKLIGLTEWSTDRVRAQGNVFGEHGINDAELNFNYQLGGFEFELLTYKNGPNWLDHIQHRKDPGEYYEGLSHLGMHVEDMEVAKAKLLGAGYSIAQEVVTQSHTNPAIKDSRRYHYVIFYTREAFGFDLKLIKRLAVPMTTGPIVHTPDPGKALQDPKGRI